MLNNQLILDAVLIWTGYGTSASPRRNTSDMEAHFGAEAIELMKLISSLTADFYQSKANLIASDMAEMWQLSIADFQEIHPELPKDVGKALAWCYTFDNR